MNPGSPAGWLTCPYPNPQARLRLFCFPYAGGGTAIYRRWPTVLPANVEISMIQLPGRESRFREPPCTEMGPLVRELAEALLPNLDRPFAFFGHSMGALICFELTRYLRRRHGLSPVHLFVSGRGGPQFSGNCKQLHQLPDAELRDDLRRLDGTPREVIDNDDLMEMFLPVLRADFTLVETYAYTPEPPLDCPISAFGGMEDDVWPRERLEGWREHTRADFHLRMFPGNHFFLNTAQAMLLESLSQNLMAVVDECDKRVNGPQSHPEWQRAEQPPELGPEEVHIWRIPLECGDAALARLQETLAEDERQRAERFYFEKDRRHYIVGRGVLRTILGGYLDRQPGQVRFTYTTYGKPMLASETNEAELRFNLTHSHGLALLAVTRGREIGVDVEHLRDNLEGEQLAERFFSPREVASLQSLPVELRREAFFHCWTRKEAYIKATGKGLSLPLDQFDVTLRPGEPAALLATHDNPPEARRWSMRYLTPGEGYVGALAVEGHSWRLWCGHWVTDESQGF